MQQFRRTLKTLARSPGFSLVVILTLAVGIGANTMVFSIVDGTIFNPFPYPEVNRLVGGRPLHSGDDASGGPWFSP